MIKSNLMLTASHCVADVLLPRGALGAVLPTVLIRFDDQKPLNVNVRSIYFHPDLIKIFEDKTDQSNCVHMFDYGNKNALNCITSISDIAIVQFEKATTFPIVRVDTRSILQTGTRLITGGYGLQTEKEQEKGIVLMINELFTRPPRVAERPMNGQENRYFSLSTTASDGTGMSYMRTGDSGAPVYIRYTDNTLGVVGVSSFQTFVPFGGQKDNYVRLDDSAALLPMSKWIQDVITGNAHASWNAKPSK